MIPIRMAVENKMIETHSPAVGEIYGNINEMIVLGISFVQMTKMV
jgi:hypothetical protein